MPIGTPIRSASPTDAIISASVSMLASQRPSSANEAKPASTIAPARRPPKRQTTSVPATVVPIQVSQRMNWLSQATRLSRKIRNQLKIVKKSPVSSAVRWSISHAWNSSRWAESEVNVRLVGHG